MTDKDLEEFEKEFGFKLLPTSFKKPLSEITKEEYRERIEYLYNAIINDDSNEDDLQMIEERIDDLIEKYRKCIKDDMLIIEINRRYLDDKSDDHSESYNEMCLLNIFDKEKEIELYKDVIEQLEYAKTGEFND
jgi:hypothetical protein